MLERKKQNYLIHKQHDYIWNLQKTNPQNIRSIKITIYDSIFLNERNLTKYVEHLDTEKLQNIVERN